MSIRSFKPSDTPWAHALNQDHVVELSSLTPEQLEHMVAEAAYAQICGDTDGFLLVFDDRANYSSPNFLWFKQRYGRFFYIDRIVVSPEARGKGVAKALYDDLFAFAKAKGVERVVCEVNSDPPNPASDQFHAALGFKPVGTAELEGKGKTVTYLAFTL
ncbi:GNAT family N-acetyltransferase [Rhodobacteraceae bacterium RKSG542]|uniref:GNAT family N-acetyltransferase n=1 Tax=Pseudovibrio flavus TaxID=2529854 RepID=UPI0012BD7DC5|nr:GNAT family N-acetyltransferase [Pseudovibrio flavus]MTI17846.1 GNAT family N-acetyltransferase [Pseudovibrio flavus]